MVAFSFSRRRFPSKNAGANHFFTISAGPLLRHGFRVRQSWCLRRGHHYPLCLDGKRACPPEDVGGMGGYENLLETIHNPNHPEHEKYLDWIGDSFDPEAFDLDEINRKLRQLK